MRKAPMMNRPFTMGILYGTGEFEFAYSFQLTVSFRPPTKSA